MAREADLGRRGDSAPTQPPRDAPGRRGRATRPARLAASSTSRGPSCKKVEWPGQNQVIQGTVVVLVACAIVGVYLWLNDQLWKQVVQKIFLGQ